MKTYPPFCRTLYESKTVKGAIDCVRTYLRHQPHAMYTHAPDQALGIVVDSIVLDVTVYVSQHPAGRQIIAGFAGQECGWQWWTFHSRSIWNEFVLSLRVGKTAGIDNQHRRPPTIVGLRKLGFNDFE